MVIQYCNNGDLEGYVNKNGPLPEADAIYFLKQIMNGFRVLHENKIMHRDVKMENFFLNDDVIILGDFGLSKEV